MEAQLVQLIESTLSADANERIQAELTLSELQPQAEFGYALVRVCAEEGVPLHVRQAAGLLLRKYINERWSPMFPSFKGSAPSAEAKAHIRPQLFALLSSPYKPLRTTAAYALSLLAASDYPDHYPSLLDDLVGLLRRGDSAGTHGAMRVLEEFVRVELTEEQLLPVARDVLPVLLGVLGNPQAHSPPTRALTIAVFRQCVYTLHMVREQYPAAASEAAQSVIPVWVDAFLQLLQVPLDADGEAGWGVRAQMFKTLNLLTDTFRDALIPHIALLLSSSLAHLHALLPTYTATYLSDSPAAGDEDATPLAELASPVFDVLAGLAKLKAARELWDEAPLRDAVGLAVQWGQMSVDEEETWASDPNAFVDDEEDETENYSLRIATHDLLAMFLQKHPLPTLRALAPTTHSILAASEAAHAAGQGEWWKPVEATLAAIGSVAEGVIDAVEDEGREAFDLEGLCRSVVGRFVGASETPFLQGRAFVFASQFADVLPDDLRSAYVDAAVPLLESPTAGVPVKISAVRALRNFTRHLAPGLIHPYSLRIITALVPLLPQTTESTLGLLVETLDRLLGLEGSTLAPELAGELVDVILPVWERSAKDPLLASQLSDLFRSLSAVSPQTHLAVLQRALPALTAAIALARTDETSALPESAIDVIASVVRGRKDGVAEGVVQELGETLFGVLDVTEDRNVIQNGISLLTLLVRRDSAHLLSWRDASGRGGLDRLLGVIARLLNPHESESGGLFVGDLIIHLLRASADAVLPVLPDLLKAMILRLATAKTASFSQSLIIPFSYLIQTQLETVLDLLSALRIPPETGGAYAGASGLDVLVSLWSENADTFQGFWAIRVSTLALIRLFASEDARLQNIMVRGDQVLTETNRNTIMTRSRTKAQPHTYTTIPFPVKALKLILAELHSGGDSAAISAQNGVPHIDAQSDDGDDDWEDDDPLAGAAKTNEFGFLSDMLGPGGGFEDDDAFGKDEDEDLKNDTVSQLNMTDHILSFLRETYSRNVGDFNAVCQQLAPEELAVLQRVMSS